MGGKTVVLGVTGGIAAYKACDLVSRLVKNGLAVHVIMTKAACEFVKPLTFETLTSRRVVCDMFDRNHSWEVEHISLAKAADVFAVAPATANFIGKAACAIADDMLTTTFLACKAPKVIAPAMNTAMFENPVVQQNLALLKARGAVIIEPACGHLACGDTGKGKLAEVSEIEEAILNQLANKDLKGLHIAVTAGPTQEALDPVRYLTNHSTGKMGYAIARAAVRRGAEVTLISGPVALAPVPGARLVRVTSALEMRDAVIKVFPETDIIIKAAAVGDYRPAQAAQEKIKKQGEEMRLELVRNPDILREIGGIKSERQIVCGFSMETQALLEHSAAKLMDKNCDMMVANNLRTEGAGFGTDTNVATFLYRDGRRESLPLMEKDKLADEILNRVVEILNRVVELRGR